MMGEMQTCLRLLGAAALALAALVQPTHATELPRATQDILRAEALDPSLLDGLLHRRHVWFLEDERPLTPNWP